MSNAASGDTIRIVAAASLLSGALVLITAPASAQEGLPDKSGYTLFAPTPDADLRAFSTDRPPKADVPYTVDAGHFQYETDLVVYGYGNSAGVETQSFTVLDPTLKIGLTNGIDVELQLTPYQSLTSKAPSGEARVSGLGDTYVRLKVNVLGNDRPDTAVALLPYVKLPTAAGGLGNGKPEGGLIVPVSFKAAGGYTVVVMPEADYLKDTTGTGYHGTFDFLINVSHALSSRLTLYNEIYTSQSFEAGQRPVYTLDESVTCAVTPNSQLDGGAIVSLNGVAPHAQFYVGLSQRY